VIQSAPPRAATLGGIAAHRLRRLADCPQKGAAHEYLNILSSAPMLLPNGLADMPAAAKA